MGREKIIIYAVSLGVLGLCSTSSDVVSKSKCIVCRTSQNQWHGGTL